MSRSPACGAPGTPGGSSVGVKLSKTIRALIEQIEETAWATVKDYPEDGEAQVAEVELNGFRLIVHRTRLIGAQAELFPDWRHHCFATNRQLPTPTADIDHRDHATVELAIRDLIDQALVHFPSGRMHANSAWTVIAALAYNLGRWSTQIGLPDRPRQTARSRRRQLLQVPARLTRPSPDITVPIPNTPGEGRMVTLAPPLGGEQMARAALRLTRAEHLRPRRRPRGPLVVVKARPGSRARAGHV